MMKEEIIKLEKALILKASGFLREGNILESMKFYSLLLDLPESLYSVNVEFMLKIIRYYINISEYKKALVIVNKAIYVSGGNLRALKQKKEILIYLGKIEKVNKLDIEIIGWNEDADNVDLKKYLEKIKDSKYIEIDSVANEDLEDYLRKSTDKNI